MEDNPNSFRFKENAIDREFTLKTKKDSSGKSHIVNIKEELFNYSNSSLYSSNCFIRKNSASIRIEVICEDKDNHKRHYFLRKKFKAKREADHKDILKDLGNFSLAVKHYYGLE